MQATDSKLVACDSYACRTNQEYSIQMVVNNELRSKQVSNDWIHMRSSMSVMRTLIVIYACLCGYLVIMLWFLLANRCLHLMRMV